MAHWLESNVPGFLDDPLYTGMAEKLSTASAEALVCEYASTKWLEMNRPGYRALVAAEFGRMKDEIRDRAGDLRASF